MTKQGAIQTWPLAPRCFGYGFGSSEARAAKRAGPEMSRVRGEGSGATEPRTLLTTARAATAGSEQELSTEVQILQRPSKVNCYTEYKPGNLFKGNRSIAERKQVFGADIIRIR